MFFFLHCCAVMGWWWNGWKDGDGVEVEYSEDLFWDKSKCVEAIDEMYSVNDCGWRDDDDDAVE